VTKEVSLVVLEDITTGEAITWNYADTPEFNAADFTQRNYNLVDVYRFVCKCARCQAEIPAELAAKKDLVGHFDEMIKEQAKQKVIEMLGEVPDSLMGVDWGRLSKS